jgi:ATP-dependent DNA helicase RecG
MLEQELQRYLQREYPQENARCEWKEMKNLKNSFSGDERDDVISYVSAIANMEGGQLVIGVRDETLDIVGTDLSRFNLNAKSATWKLVEQCTNLPSEGLRIDEYTTEDTHKTVWIIHIPKHLPRRPVYAHKKAWQRIEDSLVEMTQDRLAAILEEPIFEAKDWSAEIVPDATLNDLDELAIAKARVMFKKVHESNIPAEEVNGWSDEELLSNSGVMRDGKLTRAAIILLGKPISVFKLRPAVAEVTWTLRDEHKEVVDYEHFTVPFILTVDKILGKIRNLTMRDLPGGTLFPETMKQYDDYTIREALHNALAHQDYTLQERIVFVENPGYLYYANGGSFIPGTLQKALATQGPQRHFRNECLCRAMVNFNMIDTVSRGIKKMFNEQRRRHFPMPDYEIDALNREVGVKIYGNAIDERYTKLLKENESLTLDDCILLDAVQKGHRICEEDAKSLFTKGLIEGSYPEIYLSETVSRSTGKLPEYVKNRGMKRQYYKDLVLALLEKSPKGVTRKEINDLLLDMLPKSIQKTSNYIGNLLYVMQINEETIYLKDGLWYKKDAKRVKEIERELKES